MRLSDVVCGECQATLVLLDGCEVCLPFKEKMDVPETDNTVEVYSLAKQGTKIIGMLLDSLERDIYKHHLKAFYPNWAKDASLLSRALATLLNEIRKFEQTGALEAAKLSFDDKRALFLQWAESLPVEQKLLLFKETSSMLRLLESSFEEAEVVGEA